MSGLAAPTSSLVVPVLGVRQPPLDRLPGTSGDDPFYRLLVGWLLGHPTNTATAYRRDLTAWATWCHRLGLHPLAAERHHADAWVRHLSSQPQPRTGRPASPATVARRLCALAGFYDYGLHHAGVLTHSPITSVCRPRVPDDFQTAGLSAGELRRLLVAAAEHSTRPAALVAVLVFCGLRISEALGADVRDYAHDHSHRVLKITRKGGKAASVPLATPVVRALDTHLQGRSTACAEPLTYGLGSPRTACATPTPPSPCALQDALGHADPRTTRRYDRSRHHLDRSPNYLLATALTSDSYT